MRFLRRIWRAATPTERLLLVLCLAYILWPVDFVPESLFGLVGLTDDLAAFAVLWGLVRRISVRAP